MTFLLALKSPDPVIKKEKLHQGLANNPRNSTIKREKSQKNSQKQIR